MHRHQHGDGATIYAYPPELDAWLAARGGGESVEATEAGNGRRTWPWVAGATLGMSVIAAALWLATDLRARREGFEDVRSALVATEPGQEIRPALSPDGSQVAYAWKDPDANGPFQLYVRPVTGGPARRLTRSGGRDDFPSWSRDGKRLLFVRLTAQRREAWVHDLATGREEKLVDLAVTGHPRDLETRWARWGPEEGSLAVVSRSSADGPLGIYLVPLGGGERKQITFPGHDDFGDRDFAFSPDGRELAVLRERRGLETDVYLIRLGERGARRLTRELGMVNGLEFDPGGSYLLVGAPRRSPVHTLWRLWLDGRFEIVPGLLGEASWPTAALTEGRMKVVYARTDLPVNLHVWRAPFGAPPRPLLSSAHYEASAALSPDGKQLAFRSNRSGQRQIWTVNVDGSGLRMVTNLEAVTLDSPRWSPDGKKLVFTAGRGDQRLAYLVELGNGSVRELADQGGSRLRASWSADGRWIYFSSSRTGRYEIWKAPIDDSAVPVQVTRGGGYEAFASGDGRTVYFTKPRPALGVYQVSVNGGEERLVVEGVREGLWAVAREAVWYVRLDPLGLIERYRLDTKQVERVGQIPAARDIRTGFTVSGDGSTVAWCQRMAESEDIALVEWGR
ncbi:MAG: PD40 domain-containing protein [Bryobacterales bacterium]|nr:PD40 domain-containing protein [Bryobacterales bacterium]